MVCDNAIRKKVVKNLICFFIAIVFGCGSAHSMNFQGALCTACDILERSLQRWEHSGALSVSGFLEKLGQCGEEKSHKEGWFSSKKYYRMVPQKIDHAYFCRSFLVNSGLITDKDNDPMLQRSMY